jgi:quinohemoprotein amine dehydrogenase
MPSNRPHRLRALRRPTLALALGLAGVLASGPAPAFDRDSLVWRKCTKCHEADADGRIARIEELRTTPEEWTVIVDRMRRLHRMPIAPGEMDRLLKELSATQLLTPQEQAEVAYLSLWHNSQQVEAPAGKGDERFFATCVRCHSAGKIRSYRMTAPAWAKLRDFHLYAIPTVVYQLREMRWIPEADAVLAELGRTLAYDKPWSAPATKLEGRWSVFGWEPGRGAYRGDVRISDAGNAEYGLEGRLAYTDGMSESFAGETTLYGGSALRTRTRNNGFDKHGAFIVGGDEARGEWHLPAPDFRTSRATWVRDTGAPRVVRVLPGFLLKGEKTTLTVEGLNLPDPKSARLSFGGAPVKLLSARRVGADALQLEVISHADKLASATLTLAGAGTLTLKLAPRIDHIALTPETGRARIGMGEHHPAEGVQFEATAYAKDGKQSVALGPVPARFRLAEEKTRPDDDDLHWLGAIGERGSYVPVADFGPNPARRFKGENSGLVKVLAEYRHGGQTYRAQAQLAVTLPDLIARLR